MKLYALHDKKAQALSSFYVEKSDAVATRSFGDAVLQPNSQFARYADDFELVALADVSQDYPDVRNLDELSFVQPFQMTVIVTARAIVDMQPKADGQLSLLKEA